MKPSTFYFTGRRSAYAFAFGSAMAALSRVLIQLPKRLRGAR
jgi:hypothetical protein